MSGEIVSIPIFYEGPDYYCPDCHRLLVHVHQDGRFDIAGKAELDSRVAVDFATESATAIVVGATCNQRRCRLRRWLRQYRDPRVAARAARRSGFFPVFVCWAVASAIGAIIALALRGAF